MKLRIHMTIALALALGAAVRAQEDQGVERVQLRVSSAGANSVEVDRGSRDSLKVGDQVVFHPREGGSYEGTVARVAERSATVELKDPTFLPAPGTRAEVMIPKSRTAVVVPPPPPTQQTPPQQPGAQQPERGKPGWENKDEKWAPGMPLLAHTKPVRPKDRPMRLTGRVYSIGNLTQTPPDNNFDNSLIRVGTDLNFDNPFGQGGALRVDGEFNYKTEVNDVAGADLLVRRLAYLIGGNRFTKNRAEIGRFLQYGMPEFGVLDGFEYTRRTEGGDQFGGSIGWMPELDDDFQSGSDFQVAAYYLWALDELREMTIGTGLQATFHNTKSDRVLWVTKIRYLPPEAWRFHGTVWLDFYDGSQDPNKGGGAEVTQAWASVGHRFEGGSGIDLWYRYFRFPELLRNGEFLPVLAAQIANDYYHRVELTSWSRLGEASEFHFRLGAWTDEDASGGNGELGFDFADLIFDETRTDITVFATRGQFTSGGGPRVNWAKFTDNGRWDLFYELGFYHQLYRPNDADDFLQHRFRGSRTLYLDSGWDFNGFGEIAVFDAELSWSIGFNVQKRF